MSKLQVLRLATDIAHYNVVLHARRLAMALKYDPDQPWDWHGRWTSEGGSDADIDDPPVEESYGMEALMGAAFGVAIEGLAGISTMVGGLSGLIDAGEISEAASLADEVTSEIESLSGKVQDAVSWAKEVADNASDWVLGDHKSAQKWLNQMTDRGWTPDDITNAIENGEQFPATNRVHPGNTATRYVNSDGKSVVKDDITNEILQVGDDRFKY